MPDTALSDIHIHLIMTVNPVNRTGNGAERG